MIFMDLQKITLGTTQAQPATPDYSIASLNDVVNITKSIIDRQGYYVDDYSMVANTTVSVFIEVTNIFNETIYGINITSPESDLSSMEGNYDEDWFTFTGSTEKNVSSLDPDQSTNITYMVEPHKTGHFTFQPSNVTYAFVNGTTQYLLSDDITFHVYRYGPSLVLNKRLVIDGERTVNGRIAIDGNFTIEIVITSYYLEEIAIIANDTAPGDPSIFDYDNSSLNDYTENIGTNETFLYSYKVTALENGTFTIPAGSATARFSNGTEFDFTSNNVELKVYVPIYTGDDWTRKVPLLSVKKVFIFDGARNNSISMYNNSLETITIEINVTNHGIVTAYNLSLTEFTYREWVFTTIGVENWFIPSLAQNETFIANYTLTPKIIGDFQIRPLEVSYSYINQKTLLAEKNNKIYSNSLEILIEEYVPQESKSAQKWATFGLTAGIISLAVIPTVVTFFLYRRRRKRQKGT